MYRYPSFVASSTLTLPLPTEARATWWGKEEEASRGERRGGEGRAEEEEAVEAMATSSVEEEEGEEEALGTVTVVKARAWLNVSVTWAGR